MLAVQSLPSHHDLLQLPPTVQQGKVLTDVTTNTTIKLPATAVYNKEKCIWQETDLHRLTQRQKQINFGKVTVGHRNYVTAVSAEMRQGGNDLHPLTPRVDQVCSKRSWDAQVGQWRRLLHAWDNGPSRELVSQKSIDELTVQAVRMQQHSQERNHFRYDTDLHREHPVASTYGACNVEIGKTDRAGNGSAGTLQPLSIKCLVVGDETKHHKLVVSPRNIPFTPFKKLLEDKIKSFITKIFYTDEDGDGVVAEDDCSLKSFLDGAGEVHSAKLYLELDTSPSALYGHGVLPRDVAAALAVISGSYNLTASQCAELTCDAYRGIAQFSTEMPPLLTPPPSCKVTSVRKRKNHEEDFSAATPNYDYCMPSIVLSPTKLLGLGPDKTPSPMKNQFSLLISRLE